MWRFAGDGLPTACLCWLGCREKQWTPPRCASSRQSPGMRQSTVALGRMSHIFYVNSDSDPEVDDAQQVNELFI